MTKMQIVIFLLMIVVFGVIFFAIQNGEGSKSKLSPTPNPLPTGSEYLRVISPAGQQQAQQQQSQQSTETYGVEKPVSASISATIKTTKGDISIILDGSSAPNTVTNFVNKSRSGFYNNLLFHRVEDWVIQGGDPQGNGTGGGQMLTELNDKPFVPGSLGVARGSNPQISNDSQFFITKTDASWLNGQYTNFGEVTSGMDVVNNIQIGDKILGISVDL
jgi:peptidyl-prolyl cis-trans isomerase B (cyclophilin B)